jgi:hypothetical protein
MEKLAEFCQQVKVSPYDEAFSKEVLAKINDSFVDAYWEERATVKEMRNDIARGEFYSGAFGHSDHWAHNRCRNFCRGSCCKISSGKRKTEKPSMFICESGIVYLRICKTGSIFTGLPEWFGTATGNSL